nr:hypothetical protein [uncultured Roseococcus sp.]
MTAQSTDAAEGLALLREELERERAEHAAELIELQEKISDLMERARKVGYDAGMWRGAVIALVFSNFIWIAVKALGWLA